MSLIKLPAIVSDIDGVLYAGGELRGQSDYVITSLLTKEHLGKKMPFVLLTNGGMCDED